MIIVLNIHNFIIFRIMSTGSQGISVEHNECFVKNKIILRKDFPIKRLFRSHLKNYALGTPLAVFVLKERIEKRYRQRRSEGIVLEMTSISTFSQNQSARKLTSLWNPCSLDSGLVLKSRSTEKSFRKIILFFTKHSLCSIDSVLDSPGSGRHNLKSV